MSVVTKKVFLRGFFCIYYGGPGKRVNFKSFSHEGWIFLHSSLMTVSSIDHIKDILQSRSQMEQTDYVLSSVTRSLMHWKGERGGLLMHAVPWLPFYTARTIKNLSDPVSWPVSSLMLALLLVSNGGTEEADDCHKEALEPSGMRQTLLHGPESEPARPWRHSLWTHLCYVVTVLTCVSNVMQ